MAHDPETGDKGARKVTHVWVHQDALVNPEIDGETVTTTSDHPFWNATDAQWQDAGVLDAGDMVLTSTGDLIPVAGLLQNSWHMGTAYNLTVDDIHTYYVQTADADVLVHNCTPAVWGGTRNYSGNVENALEHIVARHTQFGARSSGNSVFSPGTTVGDIKSMVEAAVRGGTQHGGVFDTGSVIGTTRQGDAATGIKVYFNSDGSIASAFPATG